MCPSHLGVAAMPCCSQTKMGHTNSRTSHTGPGLSTLLGTAGEEAPCTGWRVAWFSDGFWGGASWRCYRLGACLQPCSCRLGAKVFR